MSTDKLHDKFLKTLPSRMSLFELRRHANNGHSPYHEEAKRRVAEYEQSNEYLNENRLYEMPEEELLNEFNGLHSRQRAQQAEAQRTRNAQIFVRDHPEYKRTPQNAQNIDSYLREHALKPSVANIELAASRLAQDGILEQNPTPLPKSIRSAADEEWPDLMIDYQTGDDLL